MGNKKNKILAKITIPKTKAKLMPVLKCNTTMKSKKDYTRKAKHKKTWKDVE